MALDNNNIGDKMESTRINKFSGIDHRVYIDGKPFGSINALKFVWKQGHQEVIKLIGLAYTTSICAPVDIPRTINGKKIEILAANEYGNVVRVLGDRILWVERFHLPIFVDDVIVEWMLEGFLEDTKERTQWKGEYNIYAGTLPPELEENKVLEALAKKNYE